MYLHFWFLKKQVSLNMMMNKKVMEERNMNILSGLEQVLCLGENADGSPATNVEELRDKFEEVMEDPKIM